MYTKIDYLAFKKIYCTNFNFNSGILLSFFSTILLFDDRSKLANSETEATLLSFEEFDVVPFSKTFALYLSTANKFHTLTDSVILCLNMLGIKICQDFTTSDIKDSDKSFSALPTRRAMPDFSSQSQYVKTNSCIKRC